MKTGQLYHSLLLAAAAGALALLLPASGARAQAIGKAEQVSVYAYGTRPAAPRTPLFARQDVVAREVVETVERGGAQLRFLDETVFTIGPASTVTLDQYVYDPATSAGTSAIQLGVGTFRFITGRMQKGGISIRSNVATIGVRGTTLGLAVSEDNTTVIQVQEGQAIVTPNGGQPIVANAGQTVVVSPTASATVSTSIAQPIGPAMQVGPSGAAATDADGQQEEDNHSSSSSS